MTPRIRWMMMGMAVAVLAIGVGCESDKNKHTASADRSDTHMRQVDRSYQTQAQNEGAYAYERQTSNEMQRQAASLGGENRWTVEASSAAGGAGEAGGDQPEPAQQRNQPNQQGRQRFDANPPQRRGGAQNQASQRNDQNAENARRTIEITARDGKYQPSTIRARTGEQLRISLTNAGSAEHNIEFELPSGEKKMPTNVQPSASGQLQLTAPNRAGEYRFYCPVADHEQKGMVGKLIVEGSQPVQPQASVGIRNVNQPGLGNNIGR